MNGPRSRGGRSLGLEQSAQAPLPGLASSSSRRRSLRSPIFVNGSEDVAPPRATHDCLFVAFAHAPPPHSACGRFDAVNNIMCAIIWFLFYFGLRCVFRFNFFLYDFRFCMQLFVLLNVLIRVILLCTLSQTAATRRPDGPPFTSRRIRTLLTLKRPRDSFMDSRLFNSKILLFSNASMNMGKP